jgi:hypothetical protein
MALKGNLQDFGTTQLLNLVHLAHKTGSLQLRQDSRASELFFREGKLVYALMTGSDGLLTSMLVKGGKLSVRQARAIQARAAEHDDRRLAVILIKNGYISKEDVVHSVTRYLLDIVYRLFAWTEGQFYFEPDKRPDRGRLTVPIELSNVIIEGSRRMQELERLQEEWKIISYVKPSNSIRQIAQANSMSDFQIRKIVYGMLQAGLVELVRPPTMVIAGQQPDPRAARTPQTRAPAVKRGIVNRLIERIKRL